MRFTGNIDAKVDAKGRIFLPAAFRKILQMAGEESLIMRRDVFQKCLVLYPVSVWNTRVDGITSRIGMFDRKGQDALRRFVADAEHMTPDGNGRLLIPKRYLVATDITSDVRFIGVNNTIEIWSRQAADALLEESEELGSTLEGLDIPLEPETNLE